MKNVVIITAFLLAYQQEVCGQDWGKLGSGVSYPPKDMFADSISNELYVAGVFPIGNWSAVNKVLIWNGTQWSYLGAVDTFDSNAIQAILRFDNNLYVTGYYFDLGNVPMSSVAYWDGSQWDSLIQSPSEGGSVLKVINNELYVGGVFDSVGPVKSPSIAKWDGVQWHTVGGGFSEVDNDSIYYLAKNASGQSVYTCSAVTGVSEINANDNDFFVFPNPSLGNLTITLSQNVNTSFQLIISNSIGQVIRNSFLTAHSTIDISSFPSGLYFLEVQTNYTTMIKKIIKE